jgi:hypothetical protein
LRSCGDLAVELDGDAIGLEFQCDEQIREWRGVGEVWEAAGVAVDLEREHSIPWFGWGCPLPFTSSRSYKNQPLSGVSPG